MRVITRADFDGIVCAALLHEFMDIQEPVLWVEPNAMQRHEVPVRETDIIANLAYHENCFMWFDHHVSNRAAASTFKGAFRLEPSAARVVFDYFKNYDAKADPAGIRHLLKSPRRDFSELVDAADKIDSAQLTQEEVLHPECSPYVAVSTSIKGHFHNDAYWNHLVELLRKQPIEAVFKDPEVWKKFDTIHQLDNAYKEVLLKHTVLKKHVSVTDLRDFETMPVGNRFLVFSLFPESVVNVKIRYHDKDREHIIVSIGHSIFNRNCHVSAGMLCSRYGGGGHRGAGSCRFHKKDEERVIAEIIDRLLKNEDMAT